MWSFAFICRPYPRPPKTNYAPPPDKPSPPLPIFVHFTLFPSPEPLYQPLHWSKNAREQYRNNTIENG